MPISITGHLRAGELRLFIVQCLQIKSSYKIFCNFCRKERILSKNEKINYNNYSWLYIKSGMFVASIETDPCYPAD